MIAIDTNILVYAHREGHEFNVPAKRLIESLRAGNNAWAIPWPCVHELISVITHPNIFKRPSTLAETFGFIDALVASEHLQLLAESVGYFEKLRQLSAVARIKGPRIHDARIAALVSTME